MTATTYVSPRTAAARLDVTAHTIRNWIRWGRIVAANIGSASRPIYRIPVDEIDRILQVPEKP